MRRVIAANQIPLEPAQEIGHSEHQAIVSNSNNACSSSFAWGAYHTQLLRETCNGIHVARGDRPNDVKHWTSLEVPGTKQMSNLNQARRHRRF